MATEASMRATVLQALAPLDPIPVENTARPGTPDVNYLRGWLELKQISQWPVYSSTPVRVRHFTFQQKLWIQNRIHAGGIVHVVLKVRFTWLVLNGMYAYHHLNIATREELVDAAVLYFQHKFLPDEFLRFFTHVQPTRS